MIPGVSNIDQTVAFDVSDDGQGLVVIPAGPGHTLPILRMYPAIESGPTAGVWSGRETGSNLLERCLRESGSIRQKH